MGRFIPRYHGLFVVMANGIVSLTSLSDSSLLVCRNARDFSVLILYFITLFNSLISYSNFLTASLEGFSTYSIQRRQWQPTPVLLPGKSHGRRSLVGCSLWGREELDTTEWIHFHFSLSCIGEGNSNPLQCSCLENPRDSGAWWAATYGVAQSRTWLKRLSSSNSIYSIMSSANWEFYFFLNLLFLFLLWFLCLGLPELYWIIVAGMGTLVPDLRGNAFSFSPLRIKFVWVCCIWPLLCWGRFLKQYGDSFKN